MADTTLYDNLLEVAKKRRNNRKFKSDPIPEGYIEKIIEGFFQGEFYEYSANCNERFFVLFFFGSDHN